MWVACALAADSTPPPLINHGFEDTNVLGAWRSWVYQDGTAPIIRTDIPSRISRIS